MTTYARSQGGLINQSLLSNQTTVKAVASCYLKNLALSQIDESMPQLQAKVEQAPNVGLDRLQSKINLQRHGEAISQ